MSKKFIVFCIVLLLVFTNFCLADERIPELFSCEMTTSIPNMQPIKTAYYKKGENFRMETQGGPADEKFIMIKKGDRVLMYYPSKGMAMEMSTTEGPMSKINWGAPSSPSDPMKYKEYLDKMNMFKTAEDTVDGKPCDVYQFESGENVKNKVWISKDPQDHNWPIKSEITTADGVTTVEFRNLQIGIDLSDSLFTVPAGVQIMNMGEMMQNAQKMMSSPEMQDKMKEMMKKYKKE